MSTESARMSWARQGFSGTPSRFAAGPSAAGVLQRKCACGGAAGLSGACSKCETDRLLGIRVRRSLAVSEPGDACEQEADRVAEQVMMRPAAAASSAVHWQPIAMPRVRAGSDGIHGGVSSRTDPIVQRQEATSVLESASGESTPSEESACPSWFDDPESISKRAAETYVRNDMTPPSQAAVQRIDCEPPVPNGNYGCYVHFSDGLVIRVIVRKQDIVVGTAPIHTMTPPPATPLCFYDYACPQGDLVLTKRECKSARAAGPTTVVQRQRTAAASESPAATALVDSVLARPGEPLDATTRAFFAARFGHDFGQVRVHTDAASAASARALNALAYTVGGHLVFGAGQYAPGTRTGQRLLAHELTHVLQQSGLTARLAKTASR